MFIFVLHLTSPFHAAELVLPPPKKVDRLIPPAWHEQMTIQIDDFLEETYTSGRLSASGANLRQTARPVLGKKRGLSKCKNFLRKIR